MSDLRKCAQDVLDRYDSYRETSCNETYSKDMEALRAALAETPEAVAKVVHDLPNHVGWNPETEVNLLPENTRLYTTPPSVDALIAEIDGLDETYSDTSPSMPAYMKSGVQFVMNKYRARGGA